MRDTAAVDGEAGARLDHLRVLTLARAGSPRQAADELDRCGLEQRVDTLPPALAEDIAALRARLAKDHAWITGDRADLAAAADLYEAVYRHYDRPFACINAATLRLLAGDRTSAESLARAAIALVAADRSDGYWDAATTAEAHLLLGDRSATREALVEAHALAGDDLGARATTRRQLRRLCLALGVDAEEVLAPLTNPAIVHYCGHLLKAPEAPGRFAHDQVGRVAAEAAAWIAGQDIAAAWGSLASGADIIAAEAFHSAGIPIHVVLPFSAAEFESTSVAAAGEEWIVRFHAGLAAAASVTVACDSPYLGDDDLYAFASDLAMGQVLNRSRLLDGPARQLAIWDGDDRPGPAGTQRDVAVWRALGGETHVIASAAPNSYEPAVDRPATAGHHRAVHPVLFGDVQGFSRLDDEQILRFVERHFAVVGELLDGYGDDILYRNTWGDGLFLVCSTTDVAAKVAIEMQEALDGIDLVAEHLPADLTMRLAGHAAPLVRMTDPVRDITAYFGRELTRAARIEPGTPPGQVYVTSAFASLLALSGDESITPEYVGHLTTAKAFETIPLYVLRRR